VWCSLWGTDWILKYYLDELRLQRVNYLSYYFQDNTRHPCIFVIRAFKQIYVSISLLKDCHIFRPLCYSVQTNYEAHLAPCVVGITVVSPVKETGTNGDRPHIFSVKLKCFKIWHHSIYVRVHSVRSIVVTLLYDCNNVVHTQWCGSFTWVYLWTGWW
jgi:hypothetical protein